MNENPPEHVAENRRYWDERADDWVERGEIAWARQEPVWGRWGVPEAEIEMLPGDMTGLRAVELGCGTGYVSAWMARRGATVCAIDNSERQFATARRLAGRHSVEIDFRHGNAESLPWADESFDFAVSEYGASIWCDPVAWLSEAHRVLRPGGGLAFLGNHPLAMCCSPLDGTDVSTSLQRPWFGLGRLDWREVEVDPGGVEFCPSISDWVRMFREIGFVIDDFREPRAPESSVGTEFYVPAEWARQWPTEYVWKLHKT